MRLMESTIEQRGYESRAVSNPLTPDWMLTDEQICAKNTIAYWRDAHISNSPYHQKLPGYCWFCSTLPIDYLRTIRIPEES